VLTIGLSDGRGAPPARSITNAGRASPGRDRRLRHETGIRATAAARTVPNRFKLKAGLASGKYADLERRAIRCLVVGAGGSDGPPTSRVYVVANSANRRQLEYTAPTRRYSTGASRIRAGAGQHWSPARGQAGRRRLAVVRGDAAG